MFLSFFAALVARSMRVALLAAITFGFAGCASLPDYANPMSWYQRTADKVGDWFSDNGVDQTSQSLGFPALKKAPPLRAVTSETQRNKIVKGLVADRNNARRLTSNENQEQSNLWPNNKSADPADRSVATKLPAPQAAPVPKGVATEPAASLAPKPRLRPSEVTQDHAEPSKASITASETPQFRLPASAANQSVVVHFANGSSRLSADDRVDVAKIAKLVREKSARVLVVGHASQRTRDMDPVRHMLVNFEMSVKRANVVAAELARSGVDRNVIGVEARGASEPLFLEVMPAGEAGNRRVEIFVDFTS